jgi:deoxyribonuclease V
LAHSIMAHKKQSMRDIVKRARNLHSWNLSPYEAMALQRRLAPQVSLVDGAGAKNPARVVACDIAARPGGRRLYAAAVAWDAARGEVVDVSLASVPAPFPYIPGLLSFREMPAMIEAMAGLKEAPDLILCDAQGLMHPRRFGLACHVGIATGVPSVGCAKTRLTGDYKEPGREKGSRAAVTVEGEQAGYVLRTRRNVRPIYVSPGHLVSPERAVEIVLGLPVGMRIPEPLRQAHGHAVAFMRRPHRGSARER